MTYADQRRRARAHDASLALRNAVDVNGLDKTVDHDNPQRAAVNQLLRRHRDAHEHVAVQGIGPLDCVSDRVDRRKTDVLARDRRDKRIGLVLQFRKAALD